jgi:hypothetical protein
VRVRERTLVALAVLATALVAAPSADASYQPCPGSNPYPGDSAPKPAIARWMARADLAAALPGELPVMAALVESGVANLKYGDADSLGYFQMRTSIWNKGAYAGYPDNPNLQIKWFVDQAVAVESDRSRRGLASRLDDSTQRGAWIADIERPAQQYRGRYQPRLAEARSLIGDACAGAGPPGSAAPGLVLSGTRGQSIAARRGIVVTVTCTRAPCLTRVRATVVLGKPAKTYSFSSTSTLLGQGERRSLAVGFGRGYGRISRALRRGTRLRAAITGTATSEQGTPSVARRTISLRP